MPSQLPVSEPSRKILHCDTAIGGRRSNVLLFLGRVITRHFEDPGLTEAFADAQAQRIWTIERAKHATE